MKLKRPARVAWIEIESVDGSRLTLCRVLAARSYRWIPFNTRDGSLLKFARRRASRSARDAETYDLPGPRGGDVIDVRV
jgi:hypothetical protein